MKRNSEEYFSWEAFIRFSNRNNISPSSDEDSPPPHFHGNPNQQQQQQQHPNNQNNAGIPPNNAHGANNQQQPPSQHGQHQPGPSNPSARGRSFGPHHFSFPGNFQPNRSMPSYPWERVPRYILRNQVPPHQLGPNHPGMLTTSYFFPIPRPGATRPQGINHPSGAPFQMTSASRPPPSDSVLSFQQNVPRGGGNVRHIRGRRVLSGQRRNQPAAPPTAPPADNAQPSAADRMANDMNGFPTPQDPNMNFGERMDQPSGSQGPMPPPIPDYIWRANEMLLDTHQPLPAGIIQIPEESVPDWVHSMPLPSMLRNLVGSAEIVRHAEVPGTSGGNVLSRTIEYYYIPPSGSDSGAAHQGPEEEQMEIVPPASMGALGLVPPSSMAAQSAVPQFSAAESTTGDNDDAGISGFEVFVGSPLPVQEGGQPAPTDLSRRSEEPADGVGRPERPRSSGRTAARQDAVGAGSDINRVADSIQSYAERLRRGQDPGLPASRNLATRSENRSGQGNDSRGGTSSSAEQSPRTAQDQGPAQDAPETPRSQDGTKQRRGRSQSRTPAKRQQTEFPGSPKH